MAAAARAGLLRRATTVSGASRPTTVCSPPSATRRRSRARAGAGRNRAAAVDDRHGRRRARQAQEAGEPRVHPGRVRATEPHLRDICDDLIDRVCERGECDFVHDLAAPLPMIVIGDMLGVAAADRDELLRWSHGMLARSPASPRRSRPPRRRSATTSSTPHRMIADRRADPTDDLFSVLVHAAVDGDRLDDDEIVFESLLLLIGGDETTRQVTAGGMEQLLRPSGAAAEAARRARSSCRRRVEEMLRWVSPIKNMARTTTVDAELAGVTIPARRKVVLLYESANFDDTPLPRSPSASTSSAPRTTTSRSGSGPTSASGRAWPGSSSGRCSSECSTGCPTSSWPPPSRSPGRSPASSGCRWCSRPPDR